MNEIFQTIVVIIFIIIINNLLVVHTCKISQKDKSQMSMMILTNKSHQNIEAIADVSYGIGGNR